MEDLQSAPPTESAQINFKKLSKILTSTRIVSACLRQNWQLILSAGIARFFADSFSLAGTVCIKLVAQSLSSNSTSDASYDDDVLHETSSWGEFLNDSRVAATFILFAGIFQGIFSQTSTHFLTVAGTRSMTALQVAVYKKTLRLSVGHKSLVEDDDEDQSPANECNIDIGFILSLSNQDVANIRELILNVHYIWALPLKVAIILWLVQSKTGLSGTLGGLVGIFLIIPLQLLTGKIMSKNNDRISSSHDRRLAKSTEMVKGMKTVKMSCIESKILAQIEDERSKELNFLKIDSFCWSGMTFFASISTVLMASVMMGTKSGFETENSIGSGDLFTTLALFNQLAVCLSIFPVTLPVLVKGLTSCNRISAFLSNPEVRRYKSLTLPVFGSTEENANIANSNGISKKPLARVQNARTNVVETCPSGEIDSKIALEVKNATFSWPSSAGCLSQINLKIEAGSLTIISGPTGSGKTSLILSLIDEMKLESGSVDWHLDPRIALVTQKPWLMSSNIRDNILFGQPFKEKRYRKVLSACDLDIDIAMLPAGDLTEVGDSGMMLSGGQRQRLAIARALYSKAPCTFLDSPFSALDADITNHIFDVGILQILLKRKRTVLLSTDRFDFIEKANKIVFMRAGKIEAQGSFEELSHSRPDLFQSKSSDSRGRNIGLVETRTAQERWRLLKNVTKFGIAARRASRSKSFTKAIRNSRKFSKTGSENEINRLRRHRGNSLARAALIRSAENASHHQQQHDEETKRMLLSEKLSATLSNDPQRCRGGDSFALRRMMSTDSTTGGSPIFGSNFVHKFVERLTSNASAISGISGFSDDDVEDDESDPANVVTANDVLSSEPRQYGLISSSVYLTYLRSGGFIQVVFFLVVSLLFEGSKVYMDFLLRDWSLVTEENSSSFYVIWYFVLSGLVIAFSCLANLLSQSVCAEARKVLHSRMLTHLLHSPVDFFESFSIGHIMNRLSGDVFVVDQKLPSSLQRLTLVSFICAAAIVVNVVMTPWCIAFVIPTSGFYFWLQYFYRKTSLELQRLHSLSRVPVISRICDTLGGVLTIRAFSIEHRFVNELCEVLDRNSASFLLLQSSARWLGLVLDLVGTFFVFVCLAISLGTTSNGAETIALSINYSLLVPIYLAWVVKFFSELENNMGSVERIVDYFALEKEEAGFVEPEKEHLSSFDEEIIFDYVGITHWQDPRVVIHANLKIPSRQKVGVCGRSGSGKSTFIMALVKTTKVSSGLLLFGSQNIDSIPLKVLRQSVMALPQDCCLFAGTIRGNVDPSSKFPDSEIWSCFANLKIDGWIKNLKGQLLAEVGELGENFSKSQRQLLNLARIVLHKPSVVLLDEATNGLDAEDETLLHQTLLQLLRNSTVITVTHRLASIANYDRVLVVGNGRILEDGNPAELLKRSVGFFVSLWKASRESLS